MGDDRSKDEERMGTMVVDSSTFCVLEVGALAPSVFAAENRKPVILDH